MPVARLMMDTVYETGLLLGLMLTAAIAGGYLAKAVRLPRVVGYIVAGAAAKALLYLALDVEPGDARARELALVERPLGLLKSLALGLILFSIGGVFERRHLQSIRRALLRVGLLESLLTSGLVLLGVLAATLLRGHGLGTAVPFAVLLALGAIATAPAATLLTLREYEAKGLVTDTVLGVIGLNNVVCIVLFHLAFLLMGGAGWLGEFRIAPGTIAWGILLIGPASLLLGTVIGFVLSTVYTRLPSAESLLWLLGAFVILGAGEHWLRDTWGVSYNFLLTAIVIGAVFSNTAVDPARMEGLIRLVGQPLFVAFFALAGYQLHIEDVAALQVVGLAYVVCRIAGKCLGGWLGVRWAERTGVRLPDGLGAALLCQAAVVIGLAEFVRSSAGVDAWIRQSFQITVLGSVVIFELCGPVLTKLVAVRAGEVKAVTLLRRGPGQASSLALTAQALLRMFGIRTAARGAQARGLRTRDVMRTQVKCIPADARFEDVLHVVEQSRLNHFPVVDERERLVGVIHFADIREIIYDPGLRELVTAGDLLRPGSAVASLDTPLNELLRLFHDADVGSLPVVDSTESARIVGIVEQRDVLRILRPTEPEA